MQHRLSKKKKERGREGKKADLCSLVAEVLEGRDSSSDSGVIGDFSAVIQWHVQVRSNEDDLALEFFLTKISNRLFRSFYDKARLGCLAGCDQGERGSLLIHSFMYSLIHSFRLTKR